MTHAPKIYSYCRRANEPAISRKTILTDDQIEDEQYHFYRALHKFPELGINLKQGELILNMTIKNQREIAKQKSGRSETTSKVPINDNRIHDIKRNMERLVNSSALTEMDGKLGSARLTVIHKNRPKSAVEDSYLSYNNSKIPGRVYSPQKEEAQNAGGEDISQENLLIKGAWEKFRRSGYPGSIDCNGNYVVYVDGLLSVLGLSANLKPLIMKTKGTPETRRDFSERVLLTLGVSLTKEESRVLFDAIFLE